MTNAAISIKTLDATHWTATVEDVALSFERGDDNELRVRDTDLAAWLGYSRPRKIRELIERIWPKNKRPDVRPTVARTSMPRGGERSEVLNEYWLTREQALKVAAKSDTPRATELLDLIVRVFLAVIDGRLAANDNAAHVDFHHRITQVEQTVTLLARSLESLALITQSVAESQKVLLERSALPPPAAVGIGRAAAQEKINSPIRQWARLMHARHPERSFLSWCSKGHNLVRASVEYTSALGHRWECLPPSLLSKAAMRAAQLSLEYAQEVDATNRYRTAINSDKQGELFGKKDAKKN